jgi:phage gp29-like protein
MSKTPILYDHRNRPIVKSELEREHAAPTLTGIRTIWDNGSIAQGLTPQRLARVLREAAEGDAREYLLLAEEMEERDPHYASVLSTRKRAVAGIEPSVTAASEDKKDVEIADAVRGLVERPEFPGLITDLLDGLGKGYSVCEIMWDQSGSKWMPVEYVWRDPRFFVFDRESGQKLRLLDDDATYEGKPLPPFKFIAHMPHLKSGIPVRAGLARLAAVSWMCKQYSLADWMAFAEVFGMPLRVGRYGQDATDRDIEILKTAVANLGMDAAAVLPDSMRIEFQEAAKSAGGQELFHRLAEYLDRQLSKAVLGQTMTTDDGSSQAQANIHNDVRLDIKNDDGRQVGATVNRDLVKPFVDLNFGIQERYPIVKIKEEEPEDIKALAEVLNKVVPLGNLGIEASAVRERLGFSNPAEDAELLGAAPQSAINRAMNRSGQFTIDADAEMDRIAQDVMDEWEEIVSPMVNPVLELADRCETFEEFEQGLSDLLTSGHIDDERFMQSLAEASFKARGLGDVEK